VSEEISGHFRKSFFTTETPAYGWRHGEKQLKTFCFSQLLVGHHENISKTPKTRSIRMLE
jgi:hypothetical protein